MKLKLYHLRLTVHNAIMALMPLWLKRLRIRVFGSYWAHRAMQDLRAAGINEEYCWGHSGPDMGGWTCQHSECREA